MPKRKPDHQLQKLREQPDALWLGTNDDLPVQSGFGAVRVWRELHGYRPRLLADELSVTAGVGTRNCFVSSAQRRLHVAYSRRAMPKPGMRWGPAEFGGLGWVVMPPDKRIG